MITLPLEIKLRHCGHVVLLLPFLLAGCGELAYKRGANANDLQAAKHACRAQAGESAAFEKCMADNGWAVQNLSRMEPLDADPVIDATAIPSDRRIENASGPVAKPGTQSAAKRKPDMMDSFKVSSWWKAGGDAASLNTATDACVKQLGDAHQPNAQTQYVTRGLLLCMKQQGWSGLRAQ